MILSDFMAYAVVVLVLLFPVVLLFLFLLLLHFLLYFLLFILILVLVLFLLLFRSRLVVCGVIVWGLIRTSHRSGRISWMKNWLRNSFLRTTKDLHGDTGLWVYDAYWCASILLYVFFIVFLFLLFIHWFFLWFPWILQLLLLLLSLSHYLSLSDPFSLSLSSSLLHYSS